MAISTRRIACPHPVRALTPLHGGRGGRGDKFDQAVTFITFGYQDTLLARRRPCLAPRPNRRSFHSSRLIRDSSMDDHGSNRWPHVPITKMVQGENAHGMDVDAIAALCRF